MHPLELGLTSSLQVVQGNVKVVEGKSKSAKGKKIKEKNVIFKRKSQKLPETAAQTGEVDQVANTVVEEALQEATEKVSTEQADVVGANSSLVGEHIQFPYPQHYTNWIRSTVMQWYTKNGLYA